MAIEVRPATPRDYPHFARFFVELGVPDPVPTQEEWALQGCAKTIFLAEPGSDPLAYGYWAVTGDDGHVRHVVVAAAARGRGLGKLLMAALADRVRAEGAQRWHLYVKEDNEPALRLYRGTGMQVVTEVSVFELGWAAVASLPASSRALVPAPAVAAFGVTAAELAVWSADAESHVIMLADASGRPAALARFAPSFPGARPFATDGPDAARPLLEALAPFKRPADSSLRLLVDGQPETCAALAQAGAALLLKLLRLEGDLPR